MSVTTNLAFNRRQFLSLTGSASVALLLAACAPVAAPVAAPAAGTASEPQQGGSLRIALQDGPSSLDPNLAPAIQDAIVHGALYDSLVWNDVALQPQPALATAWEVTDDQLRWTFTLRQGVTFHHGTAFTANDVVHTFARILGPDFGSPAQGAFRFVEKAEAVDDGSPQGAVRFTLKSPHVDFPLLLGDPVNMALIMPHDRTVDELVAAPSGTGPFRFQEFVPGESLTVVRNESYWRPGQPYLDEVRFVVMPEMSNQVAALSSGTVDLLWQLTAESVPALSGDSAVVVTEVASGFYQPIIMRIDQEPFTDGRVRQAFKYATDRQGMVQAVLQGQGVIGNDQPLPPNHPFAADLPPVAHDVEKAKALLAEAGYPDGLEITLYTADLRPGMVATAVAFQEMAKAAGITVNIEEVPGSNYWAAHWMQSPLVVSNWSLFPSADTILSLVYHSSGPWNESGLNNADLDALIEAGRSAADPVKRKEIYAQAQQIIQTEGGTLVPYFRPAFYARRANTLGVIYTLQSVIYLQEAWVAA